MDKLTFIQLKAEDKDICEAFQQLMRLYMQELDEPHNRTTPKVGQLQGDPDRYLELCYVDKTPIGFLYGKLDRLEHQGFRKVGYGYIMEFFVLPAYRRNGYGKEMYLHLEKLFRRGGAKQIYLTSDSITGKLFWEALGFINTGEKSPENGLEIYEKEIFSHKNRVVKIIKYPDDAILRSITQRHGERADEVSRGLTNLISAAHYNSNFFCAIMYSDNDDILGWANFFQSSSEHTKWFYADLWVEPAYRRQGIATEIVSAGYAYLSERNAKILLCTVEPNNNASLNLQRALGFSQIETEPFENFDVNGLIMFKIHIARKFNIIPLAEDFNHLGFILELLIHPSNVSALHLKKIPDNECPQFYKELREALILHAPNDEFNYIIRKGIVPVAWLKLNGLSDNTLWLSTLIVHEKYRNLGVGMFALRFAEALASSTGRKHICLYTTADNILAQALYKKAGYFIIDESKHRNADGSETVRYTFQKEIGFIEKF